MYCPNCGYQLPDDTKFCEACGTAVAPPARHTPAAPQQPRSPNIDPTAGNAFTWPFHQPNWPASIWMPLICLFNPFGLPIGEVIATGWCVEATRRRALREPLPGIKDMSLVLGAGVSYVMAYWILLKIPLLLIGATLHWDLASSGFGTRQN